MPKVFPCRTRSWQHAQMGLIDSILNLVGLLIWLTWRSIHFDPLNRTPPATLVGTLRRAEARRLKSWQLPAALVVLLALRALLCWEIGSSAEWTPRLDLGLVVPPMRSDVLQSALLFSLLSFVRVLIVFYFWLLVLTVINRGTAEPDAIQKLVRLHLGRMARWPWPLQILLPILLVAALWIALHPLLVHLHLIDRTRSFAQLAEQGGLIGLCLLFTLKFLLPVFLGLYLIASYVYMGANPVWEFVSTTARNLLAPLRCLPLRFARLDFAPVVGVALILLLLHWLPNYIQANMTARHLILWPH